MESEDAKNSNSIKVCRSIQGRNINTYMGDQINLLFKLSIAIAKFDY